MEARAIAKYLSMSFKEFMKEHIVRESNSQYGFVFKTTAPCAFLVDKKCTIYEVRPSVCRNYPFLTRGPNAMPNTIYVPGSCEAAREAWNRLVSVVGVK
jgi:Fe-S-cluster containining protein